MQLRLSPWSALLLVVVAAPARADGDEVHLGADTLVYTDDDNVLVVTPQVSARVRREDGSEAGVRVALDAISAASVDVVSHATDRFSEERFDADVEVARQLGGHRPSLGYHLSWEPDYVSQGVTAGLRSELAGSDSVLALSWSTLFDTVGHRQTPRADFSEALSAHTGSASLTQVLDPRTILRGTLTLSVRDGYMVKPYRFVPLFDAAGIERARADEVELDRETFDAYRLDTRPPEDVPELRTGLALSTRALRWVQALHGSIRLDAQVYRDNWSMTALTAEPGVAVRLGEDVVLSGYVRFYWQDSVYFWRRTYVVTPGAIPRWRTLDRDLSPFWSFTVGMRVEWTHDAWTLYAEVAGTHTRYEDFLLLQDRLAATTLIGVRCAP